MRRIIKKRYSKKRREIERERHEVRDQEDEHISDM